MRSGIRNLFGRIVTSPQDDVTQKVTPKTRYIATQFRFYYEMQLCNFKN